MKTPRTWNRREFKVAPNGFFTVLRDTGWFAAAPRLPGGFRYVFGKSKAAGPVPGHPVASSASASTRALRDSNSAVSQDSAMPWHFLQQETSHRNLLRGALIVVVAAAITGALLWWINNP